MPSTNVSQTLFFGPSCLDGGSWYVCNNTTASNFVGCCEGDHSPCLNQDGYTGCLVGNVRPASFNASFAGKFQSQECEAGGTFYACPHTSPPFLGCCTLDPCSFGSCPLDYLRAAALANGTQANDFLGIMSTTSSASASSSTSSSLTSSSTSLAATSSTLTSTSTSSASSNATASSVPSNGGTHNKLKAGGIAGVVIGALALVGILSVLAFLWRRREQKKSERELREKQIYNEPESGFEHPPPGRGGESCKLCLSPIRIEKPKCKKD
jgi:hypothetical protein